MMRQHGNYMLCMGKVKLAVLLENCLKDVPRSDQELDKGCKQDLSSSISTDKQLLSKTLQTTTNVELASFINCHNENVSISDQISSNEEDYVLCSDQIEPATQTLSLAESLLLDLPIPSTIDKDKVTKGSVMGDDLLCWEKLAEPHVCEVKTPLTSGNSSVVDLDLTPPSSVTSRSLFEDDRSTSFEDSFALAFDMLPDETAKVNTDKKILTCKHTCKELCVEIVRFEPTLRQLQVLHRRNETSGTGTCNNRRERSLRPKRSLKQFVPFMFEHAEFLKKRRKKVRSPNVFYSTPKGDDTDNVNKIIKKKTNINTKVKSACKLQTDRKFRKKQLKMALKQTKGIEKRQLKLVLQKKKEALKYRNKFENALDSINRRIGNQNNFWRMLPR
ncbi:Hypothetical predicted protein [Paramuricea clavata]|uniref:Uncharacterized protein n=1 Tax=Paramuricea clavata TaxID=317549 RepID=A0A6S7HDC7_PARCT|nr:Hypothetical predicted protein [Paramuricea clavata]